ncbi:hypothetical protein [Fibrivirga algicola]|uniref:Uncharacterized protein n=1 Tax=Fibrivirga algicola TaxID=2950420 RepID=A0ABX0QNR5_9BACT|nr:hypothetical protein [Fibrivirga algicola]NID13797.1 hypothetical protein [Fibrivirga algicola]
MTLQTRLLLLSAGFIGFLGYCAVLIDWIQDFYSGLYKRELAEAALKTGAILLYTYAGVRFAKNKINLF